MAPLLLSYPSLSAATASSSLFTGLLWMTAIAIALAVAAVGYRVGRGPGRTVFVLSVVAAVGLIVLASVACDSDAGKSNWDIAREAAACVDPDYENELVIALRRNNPTREGIIAFRDERCALVKERSSDESPSRSGGSGFLGFGGSSCEGCANVEAMKKEYEANSLRAENQYRGRTIVVGGKVKSISGGIGAPLLARLENGVVLDFVKKESAGWLMQQNIGDTIEAECRVVLFWWDGTPTLDDCRPVPE